MNHRRTPEEVVAAYAAGRSIARIAEDFGMGVPTVRKQLVAAGATIRPKPSGRPAGVHAERDAKIAALRDQGLSQSVIAERMGIAANSVRLILSRRP